MAFFDDLDGFLVLLAVTGFAVLCLSRKLSRKLVSEPTNWPLFGMLPALLQNLHRGHEYATEVLFECGGTYEVKGPLFFNMDMVFTCDPANIHHILSRRFGNYPKGDEFRKIFEILGDGIFNSDDELWEFHRRTTHSFMADQRFHSLLERTSWQKVETGLLPVLDHYCIQGIDLDLQEIFQRFNFDTICEIVLGHDPESLSVDMPCIPCEKAFSDAVAPLLFRHVTPEGIWRLQQLLKCGSEKKLMDAKKAFDEFIYPSLSRRDGREEDEFSLMKYFRKACGEKSLVVSGSSDEFLKDTALSLMFAGRDTTSTCLTWLFWLIATNPLTETKIRHELETVLQTGKDSKWRFFTAEESQKLKYLHGALCESLRLFPPVALEHKSPADDDILPSGHRLKKNSKVIISFYSVGRLESIWGKDCLDFKPERWVTDRGQVKHVPSYNFPAFNAGPRTCIGKEMAFIQMKFVAATVLLNYHVELVEGHPVSPLDSVVLQAKHGLRVKLVKRH